MPIGEKRFNTQKVLLEKMDSCLKILDSVADGNEDIKNAIGDRLRKSIGEVIEIANMEVITASEMGRVAELLSEADKEIDNILALNGERK